MPRGRFGIDADAHAIQLAARLHGFRRLRKAVDEGAQIADPSVALSQRQFRFRLAQQSGGRLGIAGILRQRGGVIVDRALVVSGAVINFAEIELRIAGLLCFADRT